MFCPSKTKWNEKESDQICGAIENRLFEAEFVLEENGQYQVLIKEEKTEKYVNSLFAKGVDLVKEKQALRDKSRATVRGVFSLPDYASPNTKWKEQEFTVGQKYRFVLSFFENPDNFFLQPLDQQEEFHKIYEEIEQVYSQKKPTTDALEVSRL